MTHPFARAAALLVVVATLFCASLTTAAVAGAEEQPQRHAPFVRIMVADAAAHRTPASKLRFSGDLALPGNVTKAAGCRGPLRAFAKVGQRVVAARGIALRADCTFAGTLSIRAIRRTSVRLFVRFPGNAAMLPASGSLVVSVPGLDTAPVHD